MIDLRWPRAIAAGVVAVSLALGACGDDSSGSSAPPPALSGTLDPAFGQDGKVITWIEPGALATGVAVQRDGKIVVAGPWSAALIRYVTDGSLDPAFGTAGFATLRYGSVNTLALQPDGMIVAAGAISLAGGYSQCLLARYGADGALDGGFHRDGFVFVGDVVPIGRWAAGCLTIAVQADGKIVTARSGIPSIVVLRVNADGSPDGTFGVGGTATARNGGWSDLVKSRVAVRPDGKIVVVATVMSASGSAGVALAQFEPDGTPDLAFGDAGTAYVPDAIRDAHYPETGEIALLDDGRIVAAVGQVLRFLPSGMLDPTFVRQVNHPIGNEVTSMAVQADGKIVAVGKPGFRLFRLLQDGGLDLGFADSRIVDTPVGASSEARAVALQPDGRIVVAGLAETDAVGPSGTPLRRSNVGIVRYLNDVGAGALP